MKNFIYYLTATDIKTGVVVQSERWYQLVRDNTLIDGSLEAIKTLYNAELARYPTAKLRIIEMLDDKPTGGSFTLKQFEKRVIDIKRNYEGCVNSTHSCAKCGCYKDVDIDWEMDRSGFADYAIYCCPICSAGCWQDMRKVFNEYWGISEET